MEEQSGGGVCVWWRGKRHGARGKGGGVGGWVRRRQRSAFSQRVRSGVVTPPPPHFPPVRARAAGRQTMVFGAAEYLLKRVYRFALLRLLGPLLEGELSVEQLDVSISGGALELRDIALDAGYLNALLAGSDVEGWQVRATRTSLRGCALARTLASARPRAAH